MGQEFAGQALGIYRRVLWSIWHWFESFTPKLDLDQLILTQDVWKHVVPNVGVGCYLLMLWLLPKVQMKYKFLLSSPKALKWITVCWNCFLSVYSCITFAFFIVDTLLILDGYNWSVFQVICSSDCLYFNDKRMNIFWGVVFAWSKYAEMFDTVLLIIKHPERTPRFLHWYHHVTVLYLTWYAESYHLSLGTLAIVMNSFIHSVMYYYYMLAALRPHKKPSWAFALTIGQIMQMLIGTTNTIIWAVAYFKYEIKCCCTNILVMAMMGFIYGSYLFLFLKFMVERYFSPKKEKGKGKTDPVPKEKEHEKQE